jgi:hypothetical protein
MIVSGGFNIFPREVEDVISSHQSVAAVAVVGVPDETWGEAVKAVVVPRAGQIIDETELIELVKQRKGSHHAPKSIDIVDSIPVSAVSPTRKRSEPATGPAPIASSTSPSPAETRRRRTGHVLRTGHRPEALRQVLRTDLISTCGLGMPRSKR